MFNLHVTKEPVSEKEAKKIMLTVTACQLILDNLNVLEHTSAWRQNLKNMTNRYQQVLISYLNDKAWKDSTEMTKEEDERQMRAVFGIDDMSRCMESVIMTMIDCHERIPEGQQPLFWLEVNRLADRFAMPIKFSHEGEFMADTKKTIEKLANK